MTKKIVFLGLILSLGLIFLACQKEASFPPIEVQYPVTKKVDVVDDYFGVKVADPYRWLEDINSVEVKKWVEEQNKVTFSYLEQIPFREKIKQRLMELYDYPKYSSPFRAGKYYFFYKNEGLQNQSVLYIQEGLEGEPEVFIDPNKLSPDGTVRISLIGFSQDHRYVAYSRSEAGSDWREIHVMEIESRRELPDIIKWVKFSGAAWWKDGFFYSGYDQPQPGEELKAQNKFQKIFYHRLGEPQEKDILVYEDKEHPFRYFDASVTEDGRYLILSVSEGTSGNELYYTPLGDGKFEFEPLIKGFDHDSYVIDNREDKFLVYTNIDAPKYQVVLIDTSRPEKSNWQTIIPEKEEVLNQANTAGGYLFGRYLKDAHSQVFQYDLEGNLVREIELPALGTASGFYGKKEDKVLFYTFTSFTYPPTIFKFEVATGHSEVFRKAEITFNPEDYVTTQIFYQSKDGTQVPMFIVHKKGLKKNGRNPALLYGYGGFNISLLPSFNALRIFLLENGFVYAQANLRGGGEYFIRKTGHCWRI